MAEENILAVVRGQMLTGKGHTEAEDIFLSMLCHGYAKGSTESYVSVLSPRALHRVRSVLIHI